jgi:hypothetical protein
MQPSSRDQDRPLWHGEGVGKAACFRGNRLNVAPSTWQLPREQLLSDVFRCSHEVIHSFRLRVGASTCHNSPLATRYNHVTSRREDGDSPVCRTWRDLVSRREVGHGRQRVTLPQCATPNGGAKVRNHAHVRRCVVCD